MVCCNLQGGLVFRYELMINLKVVTSVFICEPHIQRSHNTPPEWIHKFFLPIHIMSMQLHQGPTQFFLFLKNKKLGYFVTVLVRHNIEPHKG